MSDPSAIMNLVLVGGAIIFGIAYLIHSWTTGSNKADDRLIDLQKQEMDLLTLRVASLEEQLTAAKLANAELAGQVTELSAQNRTLQNAVNPETLAAAIAQISEASVAAVRDVASSNINVYTGLIQAMEEEYLRPILCRLNRRQDGNKDYDGEERRKSGG